MLNLNRILQPVNSSAATFGLKTPDGWPMPNLSNDSGIKVSEKRALMHTGIFRGISLLCGSIAVSPKHLFVKEQQNGRKQVASNHPAHQIVYNRPNRVQNPFQFFHMATVHLKLWGNFYAYINRDRFYQPSSLIPIMPWAVQPRVENGRKVFYVSGKRYTDNEIFHLYELSFDGIKGISPIKYTAESLGIGLAAQKMEASSFGKGMHAGGIIEMPDEYAGTMASTDEEAEQEMESIRKSFKKQYQDGPDSWHNILLLEKGWKYTQFKMAYEIDKLVANKKFNLADVARILGVPLHKLMEMDRSTYNNVEQQGIEYVQDGVMPIAVNFESELNNKLLKESEKTTHYFKFNLDGLQRADIKTRYEAYSIMLGKNAPAWAEPSEIRDLEDMGDGNPENWAIPQNMDLREDRGNEQE